MIIHINLYQFLMDLNWLILIIPGSFMIISTFFLCFPNILHKRKRYAYPPFNDLVETNKMFCIGHRGGGWQGPQNTLDLFYKNHKNTHMFELDLCFTKDKKLVVHHDANLMRTCGVDRLISTLNYEQLPRFTKSFQTFGGDIIQTQQNKIPLLQDLFEKFPDHPMNIQLKTPSEESVRQFDRLIRKYKRQHITIWGVARNPDILLQVNSQTLCFYSAGETLKIFLLFITGLLPFVCLRHGVLDIPLVSNGFKSIAMRFAGESCIKRCLVSVIFAILTFFNFASGFFIPHLKKRGILTFYWIVNAQQDYEYAQSKGCSGIMTDVTADLKRYLQKKEVFYSD